MLIKTRNFSPNKLENTSERDGFGWTPGYEKKFNGVGIKRNSKKYQDNYNKIDWSK